MSLLSEAIHYCNQRHPLPRCEHNQALRDHSGEKLEPPCGCRAYRIKEIDYDARREPKTNRFCVRCQKDIKPTSPARTVHLVDGGVFALHPDDESKYISDNGDQGAWLVGMDCARIIGMEWTVPE